MSRDYRVMTTRFDSCQNQSGSPDWLKADTNPFAAGGSVLVVEDDDDTRDLLGILLKLNGYSVTPCPTAEEALEALREQSFDFVLTDYALPNRTGGWLLKQATEEGLLHSTPTLVVSAYAEPADVHGAEVMRKPFDPDGLVDHVRQRTAERGAQAEGAAGAAGGQSSRGDGGGSGCPDPIELMLYVASMGPHNETAIDDIREVLGRYQRGKFKLTIRDLSSGTAGDERPVESPPGRSGLARTCILGHLAQKKMIVKFLDAC